MGVQSCPIVPRGTIWVSNHVAGYKLGVQSRRGIPAGCPIVPYHGAGYELGVQSWCGVPAGCSIMSYHAAGYQLGVQSWPIDGDDSDACSCLLAVRRCFGPRAAHRCFAGTESLAQPSTLQHFGRAIAASRAGMLSIDLNDVAIPLPPAVRRLRRALVEKMSTIHASSRQADSCSVILTAHRTDQDRWALGKTKWRRK